MDAPWKPNKKIMWFVCIQWKCQKPKSPSAKTGLVRKFPKWCYRTTLLRYIEFFNALHHEYIHRKAWDSSWVAHLFARLRDVCNISFPDLDTKTTRAYIARDKWFIWQQHAITTRRHQWRHPLKTSKIIVIIMKSTLSRIRFNQLGRWSASCKAP